MLTTNMFLNKIFIITIGRPLRGGINMKKKLIIILICITLLLTSVSISAFNEETEPSGFIFVFGFDVDVKIVQLEPGEDYVDLEVLSKPFYIWENEIQTRNPGEFIRLINAKGLFLPSLPFCFGICDDWGIIG